MLEFETRVAQTLQRHPDALRVIAEELDQPMAAVDAWSRGMNLPHPLIQPRVIEWIENILPARLASLTIPY